MSFLAKLAGFDFTSLELLQRVLLVTDGTITDTIEVAFGEPITLMKVSCELLITPSDIDALDVTAGCSLMDRKIQLLGRTTCRVYAYAETLLVIDRLPDELRRQLLLSNTALGRLWSEYRIEGRKELLSVTRVPVGSVRYPFTPGQHADLLKRTYRMISAGKPVSLITEYFPSSYSHDPTAV